MKKITFFIALLMTGSLAVAQIALSEDFSGGQMPPDGWSISAHPTNWSVVSTANAGGAAPEARFSWTPQFSGLTHLVSPSLDLSDNDSGILLISFRHMVDHYGGAYSLGLAVRTNGGAWNNVWQIVNPTGNIPAQEVSVELDGSEVSSDDLQLGFFFSGNSFNINFWYLDDVQVMIPQEFDLAVNSITVPPLLAGFTPVTGSVVNLGTDPINSFDLHWQVDQGEIHTTSYSGLELELGEQLSFEADDMLDLDPGTYELTVSISNVNGEPADDTPENDSMSQTVSVAYDSAPRRPLFEMFTSSTCPPCATFNNGFFNNFTYNNAEDITLIKYQMNWPGAGDPYYTPEGGVRRMYYGVSGVPALMLEGNQVATNASVVTNALQQALQVPAFMQIEGSYEIDGDHISIEGTVMPYATFPESRLHVVIIESVTYGNTGTNGETEFHHVMHKMMPNAQGTVVNLSANEAYHFSFDHDMSTTNVEEMDELMVVVFVQHHESQEIYQSAYMSSGKFVSFNLSHGQEDVEPDIAIEAIYDEPVTFMDGTAITVDNMHELFSFETADGEPVDYTPYILDDNKVFGLQPDFMLDFLTTYIVHVEDVMGVDSEKAIQGGSISFTTRDTYGEPVIHFDVEDGATGIPLDHTFVITSNQPLRHEDGSGITEESLHDLVGFSESNGHGAVEFTAVINEDHTEIHVSPVEMLIHNTEYILELVPVMGVDGDVTPTHHVHFTTEDQTGIMTLTEADVSVYPNPASSALFIEASGFDGRAFIRLIDAAGSTVLESSLDGQQARLDLAGVRDGIYMVEIRTPNNRIVKRVSILR